MTRNILLAAAALAALGCGETRAFVQPPASEYTAARFELAATQRDTIQGAAISQEFVRVIGVRPVLGRLFIGEDFQPASPPTALVSYDLWRSRFGGDASIVGKPIRLNGADAVVVGVTPKDVEFPKGALIWIPRR